MNNQPNTLNEKERNRKFNFIMCPKQRGIGPHHNLNLPKLKHRVFGPQMDSTKKGKMILEKSSFKKYKFDIVLRSRNLGLGSMWKDCFALGARKIGFRSLELWWSEHEICRKQWDQSNEAEIGVFGNHKEHPHDAHAKHIGPLRSQTRFTGSQNSPKRRKICSNSQT